MIYYKEPIEVLWDIVKPLSGEIEIYKEAMDEDDDSTPESYLLIRSDVSNSTVLYGDGRSAIRESDCDIILVTKGMAVNSRDLHNVNRAKVAAALATEGMAYKGYNLGYDDGIKSSQYTWMVAVVYCDRH